MHFGSFPQPLQTYGGFVLTEQISSAKSEQCSVHSEHRLHLYADWWVHLVPHNFFHFTGSSKFAKIIRVSGTATFLVIEIFFISYAIVVRSFPNSFPIAPKEAFF